MPFVNFEVSNMIVFTGKDNTGYYLGLRSNERVSFGRILKEYENVEKANADAVLFRDRLKIAYDAGYSVANDYLSHPDGRRVPILCLLEEFNGEEYEPGKFLTYEDLLRTGLMHQEDDDEEN